MATTAEERMMIIKGVGTFDAMRAGKILGYCVNSKDCTLEEVLYIWLTFLRHLIYLEQQQKCICWTCHCGT